MESEALRFEDPARPQAEIAHPRELASSLLGVERDHWKVAEPAPTVGDSATLLKSRDAAAVVVWRSGSTLALVLAFDRRGYQASAPAALRLAAAQQARIDDPTPLLLSDLDDLEVRLDDPRLDVPVVWIGRSFDGGPRLPRVPLTVIDPLSWLDRRQGLRAMLNYGGSQDAAGFRLRLLRPDAFVHPSLRRVVRRMRRDRCVETQRIQLTEGSATLYAAQRGCRARAIAGAFAFVRLPGVRVEVMPGSGCIGCTGRYASAAGLRSIIRALRVREPRSATPAP